MKLAFVLFKYFPFGGLQRDFLRIALECQQRGHQIEIYCRSWQGEVPQGFKLNLITVTANTNHRQNQEFNVKFAKHIKNNPPDKIIGFNRIPCLDWYYAADVCYAQELAKRGWLKYLLQFTRANVLLAQERQIFAAQDGPQILMLTHKQIPLFIKYYQTPQNRFHLLPPGVNKSRIRPSNYLEIRKKIRAKLNISDADLIILQLGSGFKVKGLDRSLVALAKLPFAVQKRTKLMIIGQDKAKPFIKLAQKLGVIKQVLFLGGRDDIADLLLASDVLIHPAYHETAGMALLEAICAGLPVICTDICGYSDYISCAKAGVVLKDPFVQDELNQALTNLLVDDNLRKSYAENGFNFTQTHDLYSMVTKCADLILSN